VRPAEQWAVAGELRKRVLSAFAREGIEIPFPHQVFISRQTGGDSKTESLAASRKEPASEGD
jgi:small conductance mechanosensitive channel